MNDVIAAFHFVRPLWLIGLIAPVALYWFAVRNTADSSAWAKVCDEHLLKHLLQDSGSVARRWPLHLACLALTMAVIALAGPAWEKRPQPVYKSLDARVIVLDLSRSMMSPDLKPNRLERARFKVADILSRSEEGQTGLVVFAGDAFVVSPLTQDAKTISAMLGALVPDIVPAQGSNASTGLTLAADLLRQSGESRGEILLISDGVDNASARLAQKLSQQGLTTSVMAVGTREGAPVSLPQGGFLKDAAGNIVVPRVDMAALREVAAFGGGRFAQMRSDTADLDRLLSDYIPGVAADTEEVDRSGDAWREEGPWIVLLLLPLAALAFRRGWLILLAVTIIAPIDPARALEWSDLWARPDQRAEQELKSNNSQAAANLAEDPWLKGTALFRAQEYETAVDYFNELDTADGHYNRGNALAKLGRLEEAIGAYDEALEAQPEMEDAVENKRLIEELLEQQQQQQQQQQDSEEQQEQDQSSEEQQQSEQSEGEEESESEQGEGEQPEQEAEQTESEQMAEADETLSEEERQAVEQWLRRIPDDPGGLLRRKFLRQYQRRDAKRTTEQTW